MQSPRKSRWLRRLTVTPIWRWPTLAPCLPCTQLWMSYRRTTNCPSWWYASLRKRRSRATYTGRTDMRTRPSTTDHWPFQQGNERVGDVWMLLYIRQSCRSYEIVRFNGTQKFLIKVFISMNINKSVVSDEIFIW